jgi:hypothetical protein
MWKPSAAASHLPHFATRAAADLRESANLELAAPLTALGITFVERLREHKLATLDHRPFSMVSPRQGSQPSPA